MWSNCAKESAGIDFGISADEHSLAESEMGGLRCCGWIQRQQASQPIKELLSFPLISVYSGERHFALDMADAETDLPESM